MLSEHYKNNKSTYFIVTAVLIAVYSFLAWHKVLDYWFFKNYEPHWLNIVGGTKKWVDIYRGHSYIYYIDYLLFGWNAKYWYLTAILIHTLASFSFGWLIYQCLRFFINSFHAYVLTTTAIFLFVASFVYHDVVTWGSFNAYYGLLLLLFSISLSCFVLFRKKKNITYLALSTLIFFAALFARETALLIIPLIFLTQVFIIPIATNSFFRKIQKGISISIPYLIVACIFLYIRHKLGGGVEDYVDENVKLRVALIADNEYLEFAVRILLTLGRNLITLFVPYIWLNELKAGLLENYPHSIFIRRYLYCCLGLLACALLSWHGRFVYRKREKIKLWPFYFFGLGWIFFYLMFLGLALPSTNSVLESGYIWSTRRYNYLPFAGLLFIFIFWLYTIYESLSKKWNPRTALSILTTICLGYLTCNLYLLFEIQTTLYRNVHKPNKEFFQNFVTQYPQLTNATYFYYHPRSVGLNDFLAELGKTFSYYYPGQKDMHIPVDTQISQILKKVSEGKLSQEQLVFLGYSPKVGIVDKTRDIISFVKDHKVSHFTDTSYIQLDEFTFLPIEIPYVVDVTLKRKSSDKFISAESISGLNWFLENASVSARSTLSQRTGEPHDFCSQELLIDGNFDDRQSWCADGQNNYIDITLPERIPISGLWWITKDTNRLMSSYNVQSWDNGKWKIIHEVKGNRAVERRDIFEQEIYTEKLRLRMFSSVNGNAPVINELGIIIPQDLNLFNNSKELGEILRENLQSVINHKAFINFEWETSLENEKVDKNSYHVLVNFGVQTPKFSFEIPESEYFSDGIRSFFKKRISSLSIIIPDELELLFYVSEITVTPKYKI